MSETELPAVAASPARPWYHFRLRLALIMLTVCALAVLIIPQLGDVIPPESQTYSAITGTADRIHLYMQRHHDVPTSLNVLKREGYLTRTTDGWGRELLYSVDENGVITLTSLGADGKPGGKGPDKDVVRRYRTRNSNGSLNTGDPFWDENAEIK
jgi:hypothetical protein